MAENNFGKGIKITSGFDLGAKSPLDNRSVVNTLEERDAHVTNNRAYEGMRVYVLNEKKEYRYNGTDWDDLADVDIEKIESSEVEPIDENVSIWINTSEDISIDTVPKINDEIVANDTTWSSEKIYSSIVYGSSGGTVDLSGYALKTELPTKVSQLTNDKNYITSIPSEYITEQELAKTNSSVQKLNEQYDGLLMRHNELSNVVDDLNVKKDTIATLEAQCSTLFAEQNELSGKIDVLEEDNEELKGQYNELLTNQNELLGKVENLEGNKTIEELRGQYNELSASHNELGTRFNELLAQVDTLESDNERINNLYNNLTIGHNELLERHNALSSEHSKLSRKYDELSTKVTSLENLAIGEMEEKYNLLVIKYESLLDRIEELENGYNGGTTVIPCEGITLDKISLSFANNMAQSLTATVTPSNTTDSINWTSSDSTIAIVSNGIVTPIANGNCIITATCGNYSANCSITVDIQSAVVTYAITNNLTNVTTDNSMNSIQENQPYSAILTYPDDYELSQIKVLMNNVDITDSVIEDIEVTKKIRINISNVTGNVVITAIAEMITSDEERIYITDLEGNRLLDSNSNYLIVDDDGNNDDNNNEETSRIADLNGNTLLDSNSNYLIVDNNEDNDENNNNNNNDDNETIHYFVDKDGYLVLDKNQYKIAFKPSDSTE